MKTLIFAMLTSCFIAGCKQHQPDKAHAREVFDARGLKVITSFANRKQQTISVLYGNKPAMQSAVEGAQKHIAGEQFKMVTFKQANNTYWYGSYINGAVKSVEALHIQLASNGNSITINYTVQHGKAPLNADGAVSSPIERINNILSRRALVFPQ